MLNVFVRHWWMLALRGVLAVIFGVIALVWPAMTLEVLVILFGVYALMDGIFLLVTSLVNRLLYPQWGRLLLSGILGVTIGILTFIWPRITALALLILIAARALIVGIFEIVAAIQLRKEMTGEWLLGLSGILSILFGVLLVLQPASGAVAIVWLIGVYAIVFGILIFLLALRIKSIADRLQSQSIA